MVMSDPLPVQSELFELVLAIVEGPFVLDPGGGGTSPAIEGLEVESQRCEVSHDFLPRSAEGSGFTAPQQASFSRECLDSAANFIVHVAAGAGHHRHLCRHGFRPFSGCGWRVSLGGFAQAANSRARGRNRSRARFTWRRIDSSLRPRAAATRA